MVGNLRSRAQVTCGRPELKWKVVITVIHKENVLVVVSFAFVGSYHLDIK